jgi:RES domain-containing protein
MTRLAFRLVKADRAATAFDGEGARRVGGRWNSSGTRMVYTAESLSLAQLELLVHFERRSALGRYRLVVAEFPAELVRPLEELYALPEFWDARPVARSSQLLGDRWVREAPCAVLSVPTVVTPGERNLLFNPDHPDFRQVQLRPPVEFRFDERLG